MRVLDVDQLGWEAAIVTIEGETLLMLDSALSVDDRIEALTQALDEISA